VREHGGIVECPCYHICAGLGVETSRWCRYRESNLPPTGTARFDPKQTWCPTGLQATLLMLAYMLAGDAADREAMSATLARVRTWAEDLRKTAGGAGPRV